MSEERVIDFDDIQASDTIRVTTPQSTSEGTVIKHITMLGKKCWVGEDFFVQQTESSKYTLLNRVPNLPTELCIIEVTWRRSPESSPTKQTLHLSGGLWHGNRSVYEPAQLLGLIRAWEYALAPADH